jgi:hypothetical protein
MYVHRHGEHAGRVALPGVNGPGLVGQAAWRNRAQALPVPAVQDVILDFLSGADVSGRYIVADRPRFVSVEDAAAFAPQRGRAP